MSSKAQKPQNPKPKPLNINSIALTGPKQLKQSNQPAQSSQPNQIFQTQPNIGSSEARSPVANVKASNYSVNKSYIAKPQSLTSSPYKPPTERFDYRDPPFRLTEGVMRRLFEQRHPGQQVSSQTSPLGHMSGILNHNSARRDNYMPQFSKPENLKAQSFNYDDYRPGPVFPNTPFKQDFQAQKNYLQAPTRNSAPLENSYASANTYQNANNSVNQPAPRREIAPRYEDSARAPPKQMDALDLEHRKFEDIRKTYALAGPSSVRHASSSARLNPHYPTVQESARMRNPMFASHNFSEYERSRGIGTQRYVPEAYNYSYTDPVSPKEFLKSHVSTIATAKNYDMEQKTKIHHQLGMLGVGPTERKSTPILKPYLREAFNPGKPAPSSEYNASVRQEPAWQPPMRQEPIRQERPPVDSVKFGSDRYEVYETNPLRSDVSPQQPPQESMRSNLSVQQPYQESRPQEIVTAKQNYSNSVVYEKSPLRSPDLQSSVLKGVNKQPVLIMPPPALQVGKIEKEYIYSKPYGQYSASYRSPVSYPW